MMILKNINTRKMNAIKSAIDFIVSFLLLVVILAISLSLLFSSDAFADNGVAEGALCYKDNDYACCASTGWDTPLWVETSTPLYVWGGIEKACQSEAGTGACTESALCCDMDTGIYLAKKTSRIPSHCTIDYFPE